MNALYELNGNNEIIRSYVYSESGQLLAMRKGNDTFFYHYNAHGDVIALTDQQGKVVARYEYDAWGNPIKTEEDSVVADNPFRYAGYQYDKETGMYYLIARYYHPEQGVFLSLDPDPGDDDDILTQNGYTYANNNPVMLVDPDGHWVWAVVNAGFAIYDGYKAYKSDKGWKGALLAAGSSFLGLGKIKKASKVVKATVGRKGAFRQAKRDAGIPVGQQPIKVRKVPMRSAAHEGGSVIKNSKGKIIQTREYIFINKNGKKIVIQDHSAGHKKGNQGPHFNVRPYGNTRTGKVAGTKSHYPFRK